MLVKIKKAPGRLLKQHDVHNNNFTDNKIQI